MIRNKELNANFFPLKRNTNSPLDHETTKAEVVLACKEEPNLEEIAGGSNSNGQDKNNTRLSSLNELNENIIKIEEDGQKIKNIGQDFEENKKTSYNSFRVSQEKKGIEEKTKLITDYYSEEFLECVKNNEEVQNIKYEIKQIIESKQFEEYIPKNERSQVQENTSINSNQNDIQINCSRSEINQIRNYYPNNNQTTDPNYQSNHIPDYNELNIRQCLTNISQNPFLYNMEFNAPSFFQMNPIQLPLPNNIDFNVFNREYTPNVINPYFSLRNINVEIPKLKKKIIIHNKAAISIYQDISSGLFRLSEDTLENNDNLNQEDIHYFQDVKSAYAFINEYIKAEENKELNVNDHDN